MQSLSSLVVAVIKHLAGKHNQADHAGDDGQGTKEGSSAIRAADIAERLGLPRTYPLSRYGFDEAKVDVGLYDAEMAEKIIQRIEDKRSRRVDVTDLADSLNMTKANLQTLMSANGWSPEDVVKHEGNMQRANKKIKESVEAALADTSRASKASAAEKFCLRNYYGIGTNALLDEEIAVKLTTAIRDTKDKQGIQTKTSEVTARSVREKIMSGSKSLGVDVHSIASEYGATSKGLAAFTRRTRRGK